MHGAALASMKSDRDFDNPVEKRARKETGARGAAGTTGTSSPSSSRVGGGGGKPTEASSSQSHGSSPKSKAGKKTKPLFECPYCDKKFGRRYNKDIHLRIHTGAAPYRCHEPGCDLKFKWRSTLINHLRYHRPMEEGAAEPRAKTPTKAPAPVVPAPEPNGQRAAIANLLCDEDKEPGSDTFFTDPLEAQMYIRCPVDNCERAFSATERLSEHLREHSEQKSVLPRVNLGE